MRKFDAVSYIKNFGLKIFVMKVFMVHCWKPTKIGDWLCRRGNERIAQFLRQHIVPEIDMRPILKAETMESRKIPRIIWVMWWQGMEQAPELVRMCVSQLYKWNPDCEIRLIDKDNYTDYVQIPERILERVREGRVSLTHLSDLIRCRLLADRGGIWADATLFTTCPLNEKIFDYPFYSIHTGLHEYSFPPSGERWATFFMGCPPQTSLFLFVDRFMQIYFEKFDIMVDYLLNDFAIRLACENIPEAKICIDNIPLNNRFCFQLLPKLNEPAETGKAILDSDTTIFKLSWKSRLIKEVKGRETVYGYIMKNDRYLGGLSRGLNGSLEGEI